MLEHLSRLVYLSQRDSSQAILEENSPLLSPQHSHMLSCTDLASLPFLELATSTASRQRATWTREIDWTDQKTEAPYQSPVSIAGNPNSLSRKALNDHETL